MSATRLTFDLVPVDSGKPQRLDQALVRAAVDAGVELNRAQLGRAFTQGQVTDDHGAALKGSTKVKAPLRVHVQPVAAEPLRAVAQALPLSVLHEDEHLLVVDKAAGMPVHPGAGHPDGTLVNAVLYHFGVEAEELPTLEGNDVARPGIVHRLDKDTSGAMVVARTEVAQRGLAAMFRAHSLERSYLGIVMGTLPFDARAVVSGHARDANDRRRFAPVARGKGVREAKTHLRVERRLRGATVVRFTLHTGRTHQIRMHARALGHPILGDALYGYRARNEEIAAAIQDIGRQALHAQVLGFDHPVTGETLRFEAPLPESFEQTFSRLTL